METYSIDDGECTSDDKKVNFHNFFNQIRKMKKTKLEGLDEIELYRNRAIILYCMCEGALDQALEAGVENETLTLLHSIVAHRKPVKIGHALDWIHEHRDWDGLSKVTIMTANDDNKEPPTA